jgi:hypothetical protein
VAYIASNLVMRPLTGMGAVAAPSSQCTRPQVYAPYYDSCVDPCPAGQQYDDKGICAPVSKTVALGLTGDQLVLLGGAAVAAWLIFGKKKPRRNPGKRRRYGELPPGIPLTKAELDDLGATSGDYDPHTGVQRTIEGGRVVIRHRRKGR